MTETQPPVPGRMLVISGPSGCGKSTICRRLVEDPRVEFSVSATTRLMREGEVDGRDYFFLSKPEFRKRADEGAFLEYAEVHGNLYGTLKAPVREALESGSWVLIEIDVQGALQLKGQEIPGVYIFVAPPSPEELRRRLVGRGTDSLESIESRLAKADAECREQDKYDHIVINDDFDRALAEVKQLAGLIEGSGEGA